jgi:hypothetical protein
VSRWPPARFTDAVPVRKVVQPPLELRCYCCGALIADDVALVTMSTGGTDRVFTMLPTCVPKVKYVHAEIVRRQRSTEES